VIKCLKNVFLLTLVFTLYEEKEVLGLKMWLIMKIKKKSSSSEWGSKLCASSGSICKQMPDIHLEYNYRINPYCFVLLHKSLKKRKAFYSLHFYYFFPAHFFFSLLYIHFFTLFIRGKR
jgi:hypothetical protein